MEGDESELHWVRGGRWVSEDGMAQLVVPENTGIRSALRNVRRGQPAGIWIEPKDLGRTALQVWSAAWGAPAGLEAYRVDSAVKEEVLTFARRFSAIWAEVSPDELILHGTDQESGALHPEVTSVLLQFLRSFGPLSYLRGFVHPPEESAEVKVDLLQMGEELFLLGCVAKQADATYTNAPERLKLMKNAINTGRYALRNVHVEPFQDDESWKVELAVSPATLEAALWLEAFRRTRGSRPQCRYCQTPFDQPGGRHRPFRYCPDHRSSKYRERARRLTAGLGER